MPNVELAPHQLKAIGEMKNGCILTGEVGSGKSRTAIAYFLTRVSESTLKVNGFGQTDIPNKPKDLYIFTTARKRKSLEWDEEAALFMLHRDSEQSFGGMKLTIDSWNNVGKYTEVENAFVIFDEQRLSGAGAWVKAFHKLASRNQWVVLSATPGDVWLDYAPIFIANGYYKNRSEFLSRHVVFNNFGGFPRVERYVETRRLEQIRSRLIVEMPVHRHTKRHIETYIVDYDEELFKRVMNDRWHVYEERPLRDAGEMMQVMRRVVNTDISRIGAVMKLFEKHPKLIIFYNFDYELEMLRTLKNCLDVEIKEYNGKVHELVPEGERWLYLVQYTAGAEAWNCVTTDTIIFWSLNYSWRVFEQCQGRIDRLNTPFIDLWYYVLRSQSWIDMQIRKKIVLKQKFNEKALASKIWDAYVPF